ncbi:MAG: hypothetical protein ACRD8W_02675 [Nitrososphaeraceae archaeon]
MEQAYREGCFGDSEGNIVRGPDAPKVNWIGISPSLELVQNMKNTSPGTTTARWYDNIPHKKGSNGNRFSS